MTLPPTLPVTLATALAATAVPIDVFMVLVKSPFVGELVRFVTVVIVPAVIFVVDAGAAGIRSVLALIASSTVTPFC